jgi:hypothetical protein
VFARRCACVRNRLQFGRYGGPGRESPNRT